MAKKKAEDVKPGSPAWMATFSDLMNLLLCFFVLLFSMSSVDEAQFEALKASLASAFNVFEGGEPSFQDGQLISSGATQLSELDVYYNSFGQKAEDEGDDIQAKSLEEQLAEENRKETEEMFDNISEQIDAIPGETDASAQDLDVAMDSDGKYVEVTIYGAILFESGMAELRPEAYSLMERIAKVLRMYEGQMIEIIGHTDSVRVVSGPFGSNDMLSSARAIAAKDYLVNVAGMSVTDMKWSGRGEYDPVATNATPEGRAKNRRIEIRIYNSLSSN